MNCTARVTRQVRRRRLDAQPVADPDAAGRGRHRRRAAGRRHRAHDFPGRRLRSARRGRSGAPGRDLRPRRAGAARPGAVVARRGHPPRLLPADGAGALAGRARCVAGRTPNSRASPSARSRSRRATSFRRARRWPAGAGQARGQCRRKSALRVSVLQAGGRGRRRLGAGGLLALGRPFAHRLLRRELRRRAGAGLEEGPLRIPPRAAGGQAAASQGAGNGGRGRRAGASRCRRDRAAALRCAPRSARSWRRSPRSPCPTARRCRSSA